MQLTNLNTILDKSETQFTFQVLRKRTIEQKPKKLINILLTDGTNVFNNAVLHVNIHHLSTDLCDFAIVKCKEFKIEYKDNK